VPRDTLPRFEFSRLPTLVNDKGRYRQHPFYLVLLDDKVCYRQLGAIAPVTAPTRVVRLKMATEYRHLGRRDQRFGIIDVNILYRLVKRQRTCLTAESHCSIRKNCREAEHIAITGAGDCRAHRHRTIKNRQQVDQ
jgi:hypothetical protein